MKDTPIYGSGSFFPIENHFLIIIVIVIVIVITIMHRFWAGLN
jgi:hypothetical protein